MGGEGRQSGFAARLNGVSKRFGRTLAVADVSLDLRRGEVHALVGQNGAGKSTLIGILSGAIAPDSGTIEVGGTVVHRATPRAHREHGIATVYQYRMLLPELSVAENVMLGRIPSRVGSVGWSSLRAQAAAQLEQLQVRLPLEAPAGSLGVADQTLIEIARAIQDDSRVLILDEPTASLGPLEVEHVHAVVRRVCANGTAVLYVTHYLDEVYGLAQRITALRDGRVVADGRVSELSKSDLIDHIAGEAAARSQRAREESRAEPMEGREVLTLTGVQLSELSDVINLSISEGEIVGIFTSPGAEQDAVFKILVGDARPHRGSIRLRGSALRRRSPRRNLRLGIRVVPPDRTTQGLLPELCVAENIALSRLQLGRTPWVRWGELRRRSVASGGEMHLLGTPMQRVGQLSGGNQQKVLFARCLDLPGSLYVLAEPTCGIDVHARAQIHDVIRRWAKDGAAVAVISSDPAELLELADWVAVLRRGRVVFRESATRLDERTLVSSLVGATE